MYKWITLFLILLTCTLFAARKNDPDKENTTKTSPIITDPPQSHTEKPSTAKENQLVITFDTPEAKAKFEKLLQNQKDSLRIAPQTDSNGYAVSLDSSEVKQSSLLSSDFITPALEKPVNMVTGAKITLFTPFSDLSHFETLFITQSVPLFSLQPSSPNSLTLKAKSTQFDAFNIASQLNMYAKTNPARLHSILGPVKGISDVVQGKATMIQGISPASLNELEVRYHSKTPTLHPNSLQLLQFFGFPYCGLRKSPSTSTSLLSYIGDTTVPFVKELVVVHGNEKDPMIALATNQASGILVYDQTNILLIKRRFSALQTREIDRRLYFVSINELPISNRLALRNTITKQQIFSRITTPALPISSLTFLETEHAINRQDTPIMPQQMPKAIILIFDPTDALATEASSIIMSTLKLKGVTVTTPAKNYKEYQNRLLLNAYDIAVAGISEKLATTKIGADYLGRHWFRNKKDEKDRLVKEYEVPLFSVPVYLATKSDIAIPQNNLRLMHQITKSPLIGDSTAIDTTRQALPQAPSRSNKKGPSQ